MDMFNGMPVQDSPQAAAFGTRNGQRIGHVYKKALFREYQDGSFTQQASRPEVSLCSFFSKQMQPFLTSCLLVAGYARTYNSC